MRGYVWVVLTILFLFLVAPNVQARLFDSETPLNINYTYLSPVISDVLLVSEAISYGNIVELAYLSSTGIKNLVMTKSGGSWSRAIYTISSDTSLHTHNYQFPFIQNETEIDAFYTVINASGYYIRQYRKIKGETSWAKIRDIGAFDSTGSANGRVDCAFDTQDNSTIYCGTTQYVYGGKLVTIDGSGVSISPNINYWIRDAPQFHLNPSTITGNIFISTHLSTTTINANLGATEMFSNVSYKTGRLWGSVTFDYGDYLLSASSSPRADYLFQYLSHPTTLPAGYNRVYFYFDTSDTQGVNCTANTPYDTWYYCNDTMHSGDTANIPSSSYVTIQQGASVLDRKGNIHFLYFGEGSSTGNVFKVGRMFQNNAETTWYYHNVTDIDLDDIDGMTITLFGNGSLFFYDVSNELRIYEEDESLTYVGAEIVTQCSDGTALNVCSTNKPLYCNEDGNLVNYCSLCGCPIGQQCSEYETCFVPSGEITSDSALGLICGAGSLLTGSDLEGGCLVVSLFVLMIAVSLVGTMLHWVEKEMGKDISNKYMITGGLVIGLIIFMLLAGLTDLFTGLVGIFSMLALLLMFNDRITGVGIG